MKKDLILFETAKLAKEKGFDELVFYKYSDKGVLYISYTTEQYYGIETLEDFISSGDGFTKNNDLPWNDIYRSENENKKVNTLRGLELKLEEHCERGFNILASSLNDNSNIFINYN